MDIGKQRNSKVHNILTQIFTLSRTFKCHTECGSGGHGSHGGQVCRAVMAEHFQAGLTGIERRESVQHSKPDIMPDQNDEDYNQENGELIDGSFPRKGAEGDGNEKREDRNHNSFHNVEHNGLKLL